MAPYYEECCKELGWRTDQAVLRKMKTANETELKKLDEAIADAEKNLGESEIRETMLAKAEYLCKIGDKVNVHCQILCHYVRKILVKLKVPQILNVNF